MKKCVSYCFIGAVLMGSMLVTMATSKKSKNFVNFHNLLDENQKKINKQIHKERLTIYIQGLLIGVGIALLLIRKKNGFSKSNNVCLFVSISLGFNWLYYSLFPKSTYMLSHLNTPEQTKAWLGIYKEMKFRCKLGLVLGALGYLSLGVGWCY